MSNPANLSYSDIEVRVMNSMRISTADGTQQARIQAVINEVYRDICAKQDWWWRIKKQSGITGIKRTGTANVTRFSNQITFNTMVDPYGNDLIASDPTNYAVFLTDGSADANAIYRIIDNATMPICTMDAIYAGLTATNVSYVTYPDFKIAPSDAGKILRITRYGTAGPDLEKIGIEQMERLKQSSRSEGAPTAWSIYDFETTGDPTQSRIIRLWPFPDRNYRLDIWYQQNLNTELTGAAQPMIPDDFRQVLVYGALARCYPIFLNDLDRGSFYQSLFNDVMALMAAQQREYASDKPGIRPEMRSYRRQRPRPRTAFVLGSWFDRLPFEP